jgi:hypothetical protein
LSLKPSLRSLSLGRADYADSATHVLAVDAKDESATAFYLYHGFISLPDSPQTLSLPLATVQRAAAVSGARN